MRFVRLHIINDAFAYANDSTACKTVSGADLFEMVKSVYPKGLPLNTHLYHGKLDTDCDITPQSEQDIDHINELDGTFYLVTYPADPVTLITIAVSVAVSVAVAFLMPKPEIPNTAGSSQPPSPNNALASRGNRQRLGGRVPDIFGEVWAYPDLIAPTYSVYIDHKEVEFAHMALGIGNYAVKKAYDDTTPISYINGATVSVFDAGKSFIDVPDHRFGSHLSADENRYNALFVKRYGAVNGQVLPPPNNYIMLGDDATFVPPNVIKIGNRDSLHFKAGDSLLIESATQLPSPTKHKPYDDHGRNLLYDSNKRKTGAYATGVYELTKIPKNGELVTITLWGQLDQHHTSWRAFNSNSNSTSQLGALAKIADGVYQATLAWKDNGVNTQLVIYQLPNGNGNLSVIDRIKMEFGTTGTPYSQAPEETTPLPALTYNLNGSYQIESISQQIGQPLQIALVNPERVASDWQSLIDNQDTANADGVVISGEEKSVWEGWFYTDLSEHEQILLNIKAPNGLYISHGNEWEPLAVNMLVESEIVDDDGVAVASTLHHSILTIFSPKYDKYSSTIRLEDLYGSILPPKPRRTSDDDVRRTAAMTFVIDNPYFGIGKKMRWRIRRLSNDAKAGNAQVSQEVRIADCFGVRKMTANDTPKNVTLVATKTLATEGALSLKERKLKLLVQRKLKDYRNDDSLILSNRIDDIIYHIATDSLLGNMSQSEINTTQISSEIDAQIAYFGTDLCSQFCGTFDNTDVTAEEMIQTVAQAGFCQAYRLNNQIHLHFERKQDYAVVQFNSHNILPDSYSYSESFGARNDHDGVQASYNDAVDDARVVLDYPADKSAQNPQKLDLLGVRNKVQAHMHLMRTHHKNQYAYQSCEFTGADESGIVIPTNRIDVVNQFYSQSESGVIESLTTTNDQIIATTSSPVTHKTGTLFVQTTAGTVDNIKATRLDDYTLVLSRLPHSPLSLDRHHVVQATYKYVANQAANRDAFIVSAKERGDNALSHKLTCVNYTDQYYQNDDDFKKGLIRL